MSLKYERKNIISIGSVLIALIIITCVFPREISLLSFATDYVTRPYGNSLSISLPMIFTLLFTLLLIPRRKKTKKSIWRAPIVHYFNWGIISGLFLLINGASIKWYSAGAFTYLLFTAMFILLATFINYEELLRGIDKGFRVSLVIQTLIGFLYVFFGVLIPFFSNYSTSFRNGLSRMVGSFSHPGDFSLYISIMYVYFLSKWLFAGETKSILYVVLCFIDIYLSGARTMLIVSMLITIIFFMRRYKNRLELKLLFAAVIALGVYWFVQGDTFQDLFIRHNFFDMFTARLVHWIIGIRIMFANVLNFLFGVGLNNHVDYINAHFSSFEGLVYTASAVLTNDFVRSSPIHNSFFIVGSELGVVGFGLYLRVYLHMLTYSIQNLKKRRDKQRPQWQIVFIFGVSIVLLLYCMQGWATHKDFSWTMIVIISLLVYKTPKQYEVE